MADLTRTVGIVFQGEDKLTPISNAVIQGVDRVGRAAQLAADQAVQSAVAEAKWSASSLNAAAGQKTLGEESEASGKKIKSSSEDILTMARALQTLVGSLVVKEFIDANVAVENFGRAMTIVTGSTKSASESLDFVRQTADTLGLEIDGTAKNFVGLAAAAKGTTLEGQGTRDIFMAVSNAMSLLGKSSADTNGALLAVQQIISKGTVSAEELRGQLGERLPGAFQIAARSVGVTTSELGDLLKTGQLVAEDFLPKFAAELTKTFGDAKYVSTYNAELNRLINSLKLLAVSVGEAGAFKILTDALSDASKVVKNTGVEFEFFAGVLKATKDFLAGGGNGFDEYGKALQALKVNADAAAVTISGNLNQSLAETTRLNAAAEKAAQQYAKSIQFDAETKRLAAYEKAAVDSLSAVSEAYAVLGIKVEKTNADVVKALETLVGSAESTGKDVQAALKFVIPKIQNAEELERFSAAAAKSAADGKISWDQWGGSVKGASEAFLKNTGYVKESAVEVKKQADEVKKAEENTAKLALELEKLASNERIKALEFRAEINVEQIKADAQKVVAAFESINVGIDSTATVLGDLFDLFDSLGQLDAAARNAVFKQLDIENDLREKAFKLQKELTEAQIANIKAQTRNLEKGDALIKIDGAGLQPQLEAFMWEVLKAIQIRANQQGRALLLGLP